MNRATKSIELVLVGSVSILLGCRDSSQATTTQPSGQASHHTGYHGGWFGRSSGGSSGTTAHGVTGRGGFGSSGHSVGA